MKNIILISLIQLIICQFTFAQEYGEWHKVYGETNGGKVEISFKVRGCEGGIPYSFYRLNNTINTQYLDRLEFKFEYISCDGKTEQQRVYLSLNDMKGLITDIGMWFLGSQVTRIIDVKFTPGFDRPKTTNNNTTQNTNSTVQYQNNSNQSNSSYQNNNQQEQQRQQEEQKRKQAEIERLRNEQMERIDQANEKTGESWQNAMGGIGNITDILLQTMFGNNIRRNNASRQTKFNELQKLVRTKNGTLSSCSHCYGQGYESCGTCSGSGKKQCTGCFGKGTSVCTLCYGTGKFAGNTCGSCGGNGSFPCVVCKGSGNSYCTDCNATGKVFCIYCDGTGQEFKEETQSKYGQQNSIINQPSDANSITGYQGRDVPIQINSFGRGIGFNVPDLANQTFYLAYYYGESTYLVDTAYSDSHGSFTFKNNVKLRKGVYVLVKEKNKILDFVVANNQAFSFVATGRNIESINTTDLENKLFLQYRRIANQPNQINDLSKIAYEYPTTVTAKLINAEQKISTDNPDHNRERYFNTFDLSDETLLRMPKPFYQEKLFYYLDTFIPNSSIEKSDAINFLAAKAKRNNETYKYFVWSLLTKYQTATNITDKKIFIDMVNKYISSGEMDYWLPQSLKTKLIDYAESFRIEVNR